MSAENRAHKQQAIITEVKIWMLPMLLLVYQCGFVVQSLFNQRYHFINMWKSDLDQLGLTNSNASTAYAAWWASPSNTSSEPELWHLYPINEVKVEKKMIIPPFYVSKTQVIWKTNQIRVPRGTKKKGRIWAPSACSCERSCACSLVSSSSGIQMLINRIQQTTDTGRWWGQ